jgi:hypothetical protein
VVHRRTVRSQYPHDVGAHAIPFSSKILTHVGDGFMSGRSFMEGGETWALTGVT